ncbi:MAG: UbiA family prenyltransferase [Methanobrevibacter sp.]|jgi:4-hydroxybenzoate polyprenyltransferase|nr:UbiA family prenyltransferase [Methanobrevibacter sp.]
MKKYIKICRPDHWIKQLFILPGCLLALLLTSAHLEMNVLLSIGACLIATSFIASANYVINEWLDAEFDKFHPTKKNRPVVVGNLSSKIIIIEYIILSLIGLILAWFASYLVFLSMALLWVMGILYNLPPIRSKDIPYLDVISESLNNAIRLIIGWFAVNSIYLPPSTIILGYWMAGAFLMDIKRFSEFRAIGDEKIASRYRKSFAYYTEKKLLILAMFYAMFSVFLCGVFLIKYHIEYIFAMPFFSGLFCLYFYISYKEDSSTQNPEKLFKEKGLVSYIVFFIILLMVLTFIHIPQLQNLTNPYLIPI